MKTFFKIFVGLLLSALLIACSSNDITTPVSNARDDQLQDENWNTGGDVIDGLLSINPSNSPNHRFELTTPDGMIDITTLADEGANFIYYGAASKIKIRAKGQGRTILINDEEYQLSPSTRYTFTGDFNVHLFNEKPGKKPEASMGQWWLQVIGAAVSIDPEIE